MMEDIALYCCKSDEGLIEDKTTPNSTEYSLVKKNFIAKYNGKKVSDLRGGDEYNYDQDGEWDPDGASVGTLLNGTICATCKCDYIKRWDAEDFEHDDGIDETFGQITLHSTGIMRVAPDGSSIQTSSVETDEMLDKACLTEEETLKYMGNRKNLYSIHLIDVEAIEPISELTELVKDNNGKVAKYFHDFRENDKSNTVRLTCAPQNMCYAWMWNGKEWKRYLVISIRPEFMVQILKKEKEDELRTSILNNMRKFVT